MAARAEQKEDCISRG